MFSLLLLGFLIGMRHAVEADHVAAVASLATRNSSLGQTLRVGAVWGLGHTLTLFLFGSLVLLLDTVVPQRLALWLEFAVGLMLIGLGLDVLRRLWVERIHFHVHQHGGNVRHFHAHSHPPFTRHDMHSHSHEHPQGFPLRALLVGLMHGMAGSAALVLLTLEQVPTLATGLFYIALFGLGSMAGMAMLSLVIAVPLRYSARYLTWLHNGLQGVIGLATLALGINLTLQIGLFAGLFF